MSAGQKFVSNLSVTILQGNTHFVKIEFSFLQGDPEEAEFEMVLSYGGGEKFQCFPNIKKKQDVRTQLSVQGSGGITISYYEINRLAILSCCHFFFDFEATIGLLQDRNNLSFTKSRRFHKNLLGEVCQKARKNRYGAYDWRGQLRSLVSIE
jgi:hypothetical protein